MWESLNIVAASNQADGDLVVAVRIARGQLERLVEFIQSAGFVAEEASNDPDKIVDPWIIRFQVGSHLEGLQRSIGTLLRLIQLTDRKIEARNKR